jgi:hypothetical protein
MGMLAHVPKIDDDIVMSRQGLSLVTLSWQGFSAIADALMAR